MFVSFWAMGESFGVIFWAHWGTATHFGHRGLRSVYTRHTIPLLFVQCLLSLCRMHGSQMSFISVRICYTSIAVLLSDMISYTRHTLYCTAQKAKLHCRYSLG